MGGAYNELLIQVAVVGSAGFAAFLGALAWMGARGAADGSILGDAPADARSGLRVRYGSRRRSGSFSASGSRRAIPARGRGSRSRSCCRLLGCCWPSPAGVVRLLAGTIVAIARASFAARTPSMGPPRGEAAAVRAPSTVAAAALRPSSSDRERARVTRALLPFAPRYKDRRRAMSRFLTACIAALFAWTVLGAPVRAATTGLVRGTVTVDGKPAGGARVTLEGEGSRFHGDDRREGRLRLPPSSVRIVPGRAPGRTALTNCRCW